MKTFIVQIKGNTDFDVLTTVNANSEAAALKKLESVTYTKPELLRYQQILRLTDVADMLNH